jgi:hypothetical protein
LVTTEPATDITTHGGTLYGYVEATDAPATAGFEYWTATGPANWTLPADVGWGGGIPPFRVDGYPPGTMIFFSAVANNGSLTVSGGMQSFTTLTQPPPPILLAPRCLGGGQFGFTVSGAAGAQLDLLATADFQHWTTLGTVTNTTGSNTFSLPATNPAAWFYRVNQH